MFICIGWKGVRHLGYMRVITGSAKGCKLSAPEGLDVRPTLDRVKESLFSILYPVLNDSSNVLDLFAGSGALGIEALSRGAFKCTFVEKNKKAYDCVINNLRKTRLSDKASVYFGEFEDFFKKNSERYNLVFLDPPYSMGFEENVFSILRSHITDEGLVVLESETEQGVFHGFEIIRSVRYGRVYITLYKPLNTEGANE